MSKKIGYLYLICIIFSAESTQTRDLLENYTVYEITAFNNRERASLFNLFQKDDLTSFLNGVTNVASIPMDVGVDKKNVEKFEKKLQADDVQYSYLSAARLYTERRSDSDEEDKTEVDSDILDKFNSFDEIEAWCDKKAGLLSMVEKRILTTTYNKQKLILLKISTGKKRCGVFILAGEEGRDWMSPVVTLNFIDSLLENPILRPLLLNYDFYILPVFNPDGYEYSRKYDRLWSKNRREFYLDKKCVLDNIGIGVNVDRNWILSGGTPYVADFECFSVYGGHKPISEEETKALAFFLNKIAKKLMAFINIRGFEKAITIPYAHSSEISNNHNLMMQILGHVSAKLQDRHNVTYYYGSTASFMYNFSGNCADWVKKNLNIPVVYTIYLKGLDNFLPITSEIRPLSEQFSTIVNETLLIAYDIYGPLFNNNKNVNPCQIILHIFVAIIPITISH